MKKWPAARDKGGGENELTVAQMKTQNRGDWRKEKNGEWWGWNEGEEAHPVLPFIGARKVGRRRSVARVGDSRYAKSR